MPTLIKAIFYPEVDGIAHFFVKAPKLLYPNCIKMSTQFVSISHLEKINEFYLNFIQTTHIFCTILMTFKFPIAVK